MSPLKLMWRGIVDNLACNRLGWWGKYQIEKMLATENQLVVGKCTSPRGCKMKVLRVYIDVCFASLAIRGYGICIDFGERK